MTDRSETTLPPTFPGAHWLATHQATVDNALAGSRLKRHVVSRGADFYNEDHWPALRFTGQMLSWMRSHPGSKPTREDVAAWVTEANKKVVTAPLIVIAQTPERLNTRLAHSLVGGAYHEGWHSRDSRRERLQIQPMWNMLQTRWDLFPDWSRATRLLDRLFGVVEDIRIERRGIERMPATKQAMIDLQEFIWAQEDRARLQAHAQGATDEDWFNPFSVLVYSLRDFGLGYNTQTAREVMARRQHFRPEVVKLVKTVLKPHLLECINMSASDDLGFIRKSLDIVGALREYAEVQQPPKPKGQNHEGTLQPSSDQDGPLRDQERDDDNESGDGGSPGEGGAPREGETSDGRGRNRSSGEDGSEAGESGDSECASTAVRETDARIDGSRAKGDRPSVSEDRGHGDRSDEQDEPTDGLPAPGDGDEPASGDDSSMGGREGETPEDVLGGGGAGHEGADTGDDPVDHETAFLVLVSAETDEVLLLDGGKALALGMLKENERAMDVQVGEAPWRPYDTGLDVAAFVEPSKQGRAHDQARANELLNLVKRPIATLRAKFRSLLRAREMTDREHGLLRGQGLSERMLTDTFLDLKEGRMPRRAYYDEDEAMDNSVAAVVSRDQSSSTKEIKALLDQATMAVTEPIENVGGQVMAFGWRFGDLGSAPKHDDAYAGAYHRTRGVRYDVLKTFGERFANVKWRFVNTRAVGGTPMADGIEYGLMALSKRNEAHRILFVVTDGRPPMATIPVIRNQLRRAAEAGVMVIAVATGEKSRPAPTRAKMNPKPYVAENNGIPLFDHWVYEEKPEDLPRPLIRTLTQIIDRSESKRGRRVRR